MLPIEHTDTGNKFEVETQHGRTWALSVPRPFTDPKKEIPSSDIVQPRHAGREAVEMILALGDRLAREFPGDVADLRRLGETDRAEPMRVASDRYASRARGRGASGSSNSPATP